MAKHKNRAGKLVTCYMCKLDNHDECVNDDTTFDWGVVCHCQCQPDDGCLPTNKRPPTRAWTHDDPRWGNV